MDILKWYFLLLSNWEKKIAVTFFLLQIVKKKKKKLTLLVSALCPANCADTWITFHVLIFCWNENLQDPLKWMGRVLTSIKWYTGTIQRISRFQAAWASQVPHRRKRVHPADWVFMVPEDFMSTLAASPVKLGILRVRKHYPGTTALSPLSRLRLSRCWVRSIYNPA